jgi:hypothetical protein
MSQVRSRSFTEKWVSRFYPFDSQKSSFVKKYLKGFNLKKRFTCQELFDKQILVTVENSVDKENLVFDIIYFPNTKSVLLQPSVNGRLLLPNTVCATLVELVNYRKSGVTELVAEDNGQAIFSFNCQNLCVFIRDVFLGLVCPRCEVKYDRKCRNCEGKGLIPENVQICFKCYGSGKFPKGSRTTCGLCKSKGFVDPTWNKCKTCNGIGSKMQKDQGGTFVYPCEQCHSLGYYLGAKVAHGLQHEVKPIEEVKTEEPKSVQVMVEDYPPPPPDEEEEPTLMSIPEEPVPVPVTNVVFDRKALKNSGHKDVNGRHPTTPEPLHQTTPSLLNIQIEQPTPETLVINGIVHYIHEPRSKTPDKSPEFGSPRDSKVDHVPQPIAPTIVSPETLEPVVHTEPVVPVLHIEPHVEPINLEVPVTETQQ